MLHKVGENCCAKTFASPKSEQADRVPPVRCLFFILLEIVEKEGLVFLVEEQDDCGAAQRAGGCGRL